MLKKLSYLAFIVLLVQFKLNAQAPIATITVPSGTLCSETVYTFSSSVTGTVTAYSWSVTPRTGVEFVTDGSADFVRLRFTSPSTFSVSLFVANSTGTFATGSLVSISRSAKANYNAVLNNAGFPADLVLTNASTFANAFLWDFGSAAPSQTVSNAIQSYTAPGSYSVGLVAYGVNGCNDTLAYNFVIDDFSEVKLTNIFTPNNDGVNDVFRPITKGLSELKVWIYNRWGVLMHSWDGTKGSWDGYTTGGLQCPDGVYMYVLEAKGFDGKEYKMKSNLTLTR